MKRLRALFTRKPTQVFNVYVNNPAPEPVSESVAAAVRRQRHRNGGGPGAAA